MLTSSSQRLATTPQIRKAIFDGGRLCGEKAVAEWAPSSLLTGDGHTVSTATNGLEALEKFQTGWFDAVVTDHAMPQMSGAELAVMIKRLAPRKPVIVMLTGVADVLDAKEKPQGVDIIIDKPVTLLALREALSTVK